MKLLTKVEEFILLAIWSLQENAYSLAIQKHISEISDEKWSLGTIYAPLERLEKRGYIHSHISFINGGNLPFGSGMSLYSAAQYEGPYYHEIQNGQFKTTAPCADRLVSP